MAFIVDAVTGLLNVILSQDCHFKTSIFYCSPTTTKKDWTNEALKVT